MPVWMAMDSCLLVCVHDAADAIMLLMCPSSVVCAFWRATVVHGSEMRCNVPGVCVSLGVCKSMHVLGNKWLRMNQSGWDVKRGSCAALAAPCKFFGEDIVVGALHMHCPLLGFARSQQHAGLVRIQIEGMSISCGIGNSLDGDSCIG